MAKNKYRKVMKKNYSPRKLKTLRTKKIIEQTIERTIFIPNQKRIKEINKKKIEENLSSQKNV